MNSWCLLSRVERISVVVTDLRVGAGRGDVDTWR